MSLIYLNLSKYITHKKGKTTSIWYGHWHFKVEVNKYVIIFILYICSKK